jgi:8-oxo-dGTP diphosphatase
MDHRPIIYVACGVLRNARGEVLIAQRPEGKIAAGKWEFPGGKIEPGESTAQALARELHEELAVEVRRARRLIRFRHAYSDRVVILDTWLVTGFEGEPQPRERQDFAWLRPEDLHRLDNLPTVGPIVCALRLPEHYVFTRPNADEASIRQGLKRLPAGCLLRLRLPALEDAAYAALATRLLPVAREAGVGLMLDRQPLMASQLGATGWHATERALLRRRATRPVPAGMWFGASVHSAESLAAAQQAGADFAVLGSVLPTATHAGAHPLGWAGFETLVDSCALPVYAIGGVGPELLEAAHAHGAQGVAGISAYW